jgi:hypothetical protein
MALPIKPIEHAIIHYPGEPNAGIRSASFLMELFIDPAAYEKEELQSLLTNTRELISRLYETFSDGRPSKIHFDFELPNFDPES